MRSSAWWHANLALLKTIQPGNMQQERASGRTIRGCLAISRLRLRRRGCVGPAELPTLRCTVSWRKYLPSSTTD
jgi:hypothetical protein